jgi:hypothetical protein
MVLFTVGGLPAHPLLVHAVVVLIPLAALGAVAVAIRTRWNRPYAPLVAFGAVVAAIAATLAKPAGEQLLVALKPSPAYGALLAEHGRFGLYTLIAAWIFAGFATATAVLGRRTAGGPLLVTGGISAVVGIVALVLATIAGHLGSISVWGHLVGLAP